MAVLFIQAGFTGEVEVNPRLVRILSTDDIDTILIAGYLNSEKDFVGYPLKKTDFVFCAYGDLTNPSHAQLGVEISDSGIITLSETTSFTNPMTALGDLIVGEAGGNPGRLGVGLNTYVLTANSGAPLGVNWAPAPSGFENPMTAQGDMIIGGAIGIAQRLGIGVGGQYLQSNGDDPIWSNLLVDLSSQVSGNLSVSHLNSGLDADNTTFFRGDGVWAPPPGAGDFLPLAGGTMTGNLILNANATLPLQAVTLEQLQAAQFSFLAHAPVVAATAAAIVGTYNNGASGVGATITTTVTGLQLIDGYTPSLNDRVLIQTQVSAADNGIYTITVLGDTGVSQVYTRATDFNTVGATGVATGAYVIVDNGDTYINNTIWMSAQGPFTIGTTPLTWSVLTIQPTLNFTGNLTQTGSNVTFSDPFTTLTNFGSQFAQFDDNSGIQDVNGDPLLTFTSDLSAINYFTMKNGASGVSPIFSVVSNDGDSPGMIFSAVAGIYAFQGTMTNGALVALFDNTNTNVVELLAPNSVSSYQIVFPVAQAAQGGQTFINDSTGILTWDFPSKLGPNASSNNFIAGTSIITSAAGTTILTSASNYWQAVVGGDDQTIQLPDATTLSIGWPFKVRSLTSGLVTVNDGASGLVTIAPSGAVIEFLLADNGSTAGSWIFSSELPQGYEAGTSGFSTTGFLSALDSGTGFHAGFTAASLSSNITWALPDADGTAGQVISTDGLGALSFVDNGGSSSSAANPNALQAGDFNINPWQKGTSVANGGGGGMTADRWKWTAGGSISGDVIVSQDANAPTVAQCGLVTQSMKITVNTPDPTPTASIYAINQLMEGYQWSDISQQETTLSFWIYSNITGTYSIYLRNTSETSDYLTSFTISASNTWEFKTINILASPSVGTWNYGSGQSMDIFFCLDGSQTGGTPDVWSTGGASNDFLVTGQAAFMATAANALYIALPKWEVGSTATPWITENIQSVLAQCQRFYWKSFAQGTTPATQVGTNALNWQGVAVGAVSAKSQFFDLPVTMWTAGSATIYNPVNNNNQVYNADLALDGSSGTVSVTTNGFQLNYSAPLASAIGNNFRAHVVVNASI